MHLGRVAKLLLEHSGWMNYCQLVEYNTKRGLVVDFYFFFHVTTKVISDKFERLEAADGYKRLWLTQHNKRDQRIRFSINLEKACFIKGGLTVLSSVCATLCHAPLKALRDHINCFTYLLLCSSWFPLMLYAVKLAIRLHITSNVSTPCLVLPFLVCRETYIGHETWGKIQSHPKQHAVQHGMGPLSLRYKRLIVAGGFHPSRLQHFPSAP